ncbi:MAG: DUF2442 domain-containing protein [Acidobacteria bacterium]|nr:DUF2442 domain-containing protein [Acidobacteriota bacterium]
MNHAIHRVTRFEIIARYTLAVRFADATARTINFLPVLAGEIYGPLRDLSLFEQVQVDPEVHTLVWPNGADFEPAILHDWPVCEKAFRERARRWEPVHR